ERFVRGTKWNTGSPLPTHARALACFLLLKMLDAFLKSFFSHFSLACKNALGTVRSGLLRKLERLVRLWAGVACQIMSRLYRNKNVVIYENQVMLSTLRMYET